MNKSITVTEGIYKVVIDYSEELSIITKCYIGNKIVKEKDAVANLKKLAQQQINRFAK